VDISMIYGRSWSSVSNFSKEHKKYLLNIKRDTKIVRISQLLIFILFFGIWQLSASFGLIDTFLTSSPFEIVNMVKTFISNGSLLNHIYVSTMETIAGFLLGTIVGIAVAILLWMSKRSARIFEPYLIVLNSLPKTALAPIIILWAGAGFSGIVVTAASISVVVTTLSVYTGFISVEQDKVTLLKSFGANKLQILQKLIIPANIPVLLSVIKVNIGLSWVGVIVGEFLVSKAGIGYLIVYGSQVFKLDLVMMGVFVLAIIAAIMYYVAMLLEKKLVKY
jgi:NitT/TauT family transport system permease protein